MKVEAVCKECGKVFVKYSYSRTTRCDTCLARSRPVARGPVNERALQVLMLSARGRNIDRILGVELGADDYVVKTYSPRELTRRLIDVLGHSTSETFLEFSYWQEEGLHVDFEAHRVLVEGVEVQLTATEFKLLAELIRSRGVVLSREDLLDKVWGYRYDGYNRTIDTHVRRLRHKISPYSQWVETVRGVGYRFKT
ncbi:MAG: response regulator transcription factor [Deltaproteobacteria bacterium]|nr:response regulator transcription factor [Deltaproteobacteria bacterium]